MYAPPFSIVATRLALCLAAPQLRPALAAHGMPLLPATLRRPRGAFRALCREHGVRDADASTGAEIYGDVLHGDVEVPNNLAQLQDVRAYVVRRLEGAALMFGSYSLPSLPITVLTTTPSLLVLEVLIERRDGKPIRLG